MRRNYVKMTVAALACAALVPVMAACGSEQPVMSDMGTSVTTTQPEQTTAQPEKTTAQPEKTTAQPGQTTAQPEQTTTQPEQTTAQPEQTTTQPEQTTTQPEQTTAQPEQTTTQPEQTATSGTQQWIDSLYNALIQNDVKTVVTLLGNVENARAHCASYEYAWRNLTFARPEGFMLTASDGTKFGVGVFDSSPDEYDNVSAFVSYSDDEYGFHCIYAGDHYVSLNGDGSYAYLKGNDLISSRDGVESVLYSCEPGGEVESWY